MDLLMGPNRNEKGMNKALGNIRDLRSNGLPRVEVTGGRIFNLDWRAAVELSMELELAELVTRSALQRKETRGHHFRSDFPETSEEPQHTLVRKRGETIQVADTPVIKLNS
jgi:succinate dehydrogenase/fumarate reductase flavoprotein subunit